MSLVGSHRRVCPTGDASCRGPVWEPDHETNEIFNTAVYGPGESRNEAPYQHSTNVTRPFWIYKVHNSGGGKRVSPEKCGTRAPSVLTARVAQRKGCHKLVPVSLLDSARVGIHAALPGQQHHHGGEHAPMLRRRGASSLSAASHIRILWTRPPGDIGRGRHRADFCGIFYRWNRQVGWTPLYILTQLYQFREDRRRPSVEFHKKSQNTSTGTC